MKYHHRLAPIAVVKMLCLMPFLLTTSCTSPGHPAEMVKPDPSIMCTNLNRLVVSLIENEHRYVANGFQSLQLSFPDLQFSKRGNNAIKVRLGVYELFAQIWNLDGMNNNTLMFRFEGFNSDMNRASLQRRMIRACDFSEALTIKLQGMGFKKTKSNPRGYILIQYFKAVNYQEGRSLTVLVYKNKVESILYATSDMRPLEI